MPNDLPVLSHNLFAVPVTRPAPQKGIPPILREPRLFVVAQELLTPTLRGEVRPFGQAHWVALPINFVRDAHKILDDADNYCLLRHRGGGRFSALDGYLVLGSYADLKPKFPRFLPRQVNYSAMAAE